MTSLFALRALLVAGELLASSSMVMAFAWTLASRKNAGSRHLAWAAAFGAALVLPLFAAILPSPLRVLLPAGPAVSAIPAFPSSASAATALPVSAGIGFSYNLSTVALALGVFWLAGVLVVAIRFAAGTFCLAALRRRSRPFACAPENLPRVSATRRECELRLADSEYGPVTWGLLRPVILLPRTAVFWPRERLHAVLLHELAHVRRRDSLVQGLSLLVCALYWPNPLVWLGARALRREAEMAADDSVLRAGLKPSSYANELLHLAAEFRARQPAYSALSLFMAAPSALHSRVESVLEPTALRTGVTRSEIAKTAAAALVSAAAIALACPSFAQASAPATPPSPPAPAVPAAPPAPPAPPAPGEAVAPEAPPAVHVRVHGLRHADIERMRRTALRESREAIARARPEIERALAEANIGERAMQAVQESRPAIDSAIEGTHTAEMNKAQIDRALDEARAELARAHIDAKLQEHVRAALKCAEARLKAAEARERAADADDTEDSSAQDN